MCRHYERKLEQFHTHTPWIAEFWNTVSNLPFILIGIIRLETQSKDPKWFNSCPLQLQYQLMIFTGICSAIHHATTQKWTIIVDWIPIAFSILLNLNYLSYAELPEILILLVALIWLLIDHVVTPMPVPWGHVVWHIMAAYSVDAFYQKIERNILMSELILQSMPPLAHP